MSRPKVSIIVLSYNQRNTIGRTLDSILRQRCSFPYEIIIGDDASTDGTRAICEEYAARYPDIIRLMPAAPNKGVVDNYFDCLLECRGQYISDCAGDDEWGDIDRMQRQTEYLDAHPEEVAVMSDWIIIRDGTCRNSGVSEIYNRLHNCVSSQDRLKVVLGKPGVFPFLSAMIYCRDTLLKFYHSNPQNTRRCEWGCEDLPVICALASLGRFGYVPLIASVYYQAVGSITNSKDKYGIFDFALKSTAVRLSLCKIYNIDLQEVSGGLSRVIRYSIGLAFKLHEREATRRLFKCLDGVSLKLPLVSRIKLFLLRFYM